jgi:hypothetical protein
VFDKFTFEINVRDGDAEEPLITTTNTWIFPRQEGEA